MIASAFSTVLCSFFFFFLIFLLLFVLVLTTYEICFPFAQLSPSSLLVSILNYYIYTEYFENCIKTCIVIKTQFEINPKNILKPIWIIKNILAC